MPLSPRVMPAHLPLPWTRESVLYRVRADSAEAADYSFRYTKTTCSRCKAEFYSRTMCGGFCSAECAKADLRERRKAKRHEKRALAVRDFGTCIACGTALQEAATRSTRRYCSNACRQKAYRKALQQA